jgi:hypothetical protein
MPAFAGMTLTFLNDPFIFKRLTRLVAFADYLHELVDIHQRYRIGRVLQICGPFPDIADHVKEAVAIGGKRLDMSRRWPVHQPDDPLGSEEAFTARGDPCCWLLAWVLLVSYCT